LIAVHSLQRGRNPWAWHFCPLIFELGHPSTRFMTEFTSGLTAYISGLAVAPVLIMSMD